MKEKESASLLVLRGRRRIGKSRLIQEFSKSFKNYFEIQGLGPKEGISRQDQLENFATKLSLRFNSRKKKFEDWTEALSDLATLTRKGEWLILLDEISWMAKADELFPEKFKAVWDSQLKINQKLILVLCGSVSSWIEDNIVRNTVFEGRISLDLTLDELTLPEINQFWEKQNYNFGSLEKMMILSVSGGVPKYLEEILATESAEANVMRLCFKPSGFLFYEYEKIFGEIFQRKSETMEKIVRACLTKKRTPIELSKTLKTNVNSDFTNNLRILELAGFVSRDRFFQFDGSLSKHSHIRVKDNYLRFYLKYIEPLKNRIEKGGKVVSRWGDLPAFESILGLQFENLILANRRLLYPFLNLEDRDVVSAAPYLQKKTTKNLGGCQIDLLIHTTLDLFFLCEMKCRKSIDSSVIKEVQRKMDLLSLPKRSSIKPVLVYEGELYPPHIEKLKSFFYRIIHLSDLYNSAQI